MNKIAFGKNAVKNPLKKETKTTVEFAGFVADQFRKLTKKNLRIPVQLYQL